MLEQEACRPKRSPALCHSQARPQPQLPSQQQRPSSQSQQQLPPELLTPLRLPLSQLRQRLRVWLRRRRRWPKGAARAPSCEV